MHEWKKELITGIAHLYDKTNEKGRTEAACGHVSYTKLTDLNDRPERTILCSSCLWIEGEERIKEL